MDTQAPAAEASAAPNDAPAATSVDVGEPARSARAQKDVDRAKIIADYKKARAKSATEPKPEDPPPGEEPKPGEDPKPAKKPANRGKFTAKIAALETELAAAKSSTRDAFIALIKEDPSELFRAIDDPELLTKLAEARHNSFDPVAQAKREGEKALAAIKKERTDAEEATKAAQARSADANTHAAFANVLRDGIKSDDGSIVVPGRWKIAQAMAADGEDLVWTDSKGGKSIVDVPRAAMLSYSELRRGLGRTVNEAETATLLEIVYDKIEAKLAGKGKYWAAPGTAPKAADGSPRTITSQGAPGRPAARPPERAKAATKEDKKVSILENYRQQRLRQRANEAS